MKLIDLLYINKSDRQVLLVLFSLAAIVIGVTYLVGDNDGNTVQRRDGSIREYGDSTTHHSSLASPTSGGKRSSRSSSTEYYATTSHVKRELFTFDPNTADSTQLLRLGLRPWQVRNIYRYRANGGVYRKKEDFARLYGLTVKDYRELEPYIRISADYLPASTLFDQKNHEDAPAARGDTLRRPAKLFDGETIDLNIADTTMLKTVPGIGSYYASRIARYGQKLGGYVSTDQLDEIEDFPAAAKQYFIVSQPHPRQLNINRLSLNDLKRHPYINYYQARAIVDYRRLHGPIHSLEELRLLPEFSPEAISRLVPYVTCE